MVGNLVLQRRASGAINVSDDTPPEMTIVNMVIPILHTPSTASLNIYFIKNSLHLYFQLIYRCDIKSAER